MSDPAATRAAVAQAFARALFDTLATDGKLQAESAIAGMARMAGTYYFRSFGYAALKLVPGQAVLSQEANEKGPELMNLTHELLARLGVRLDDARVREAIADTQGAHKPMMEFRSTQPRLEQAFLPIREQYGLSNVDAGKAAACATALLIHNCQSVLDPAIAYGVAVYGFIEGSKTTPWPPAA